MKSTLPITLLAIGALCLPISAQTQTNNSRSKAASQQASSSACWTCSFGDGGDMDGKICLRLDQIVSVSLHSYLLNSSVPILELTIDTTGNNSIRMYGVMSPETTMTSDMQKMLGEMKEEAKKTSELNVPQVAKQYPQTTHAHSIEYSVFDTSELQSAYNSLVRAMQTGRSARCSISQ